jgi:hypothetical protein
MFVAVGLVAMFWLDVHTDCTKVMVVAQNEAASDVHTDCTKVMVVAQNEALPRYSSNSECHIVVVHTCYLICVWKESKASLDWFSGSASPTASFAALSYEISPKSDSNCG